MDKRIVYTLDGQVNVIVPSPRWGGTAEELAEKDVPEGVSFRIVDVKSIPQSRNWRDAWVEGDLVTVDLEQAKEAHKSLMIQKAKERVLKDEFGVQDFTIVKNEIDAIDFTTITTLDELYNTFPDSIDLRSENREYKMHDLA